MAAGLVFSFLFCALPFNSFIFVSFVPRFKAYLHCARHQPRHRGDGQLGAGIDSGSFYPSGLELGERIDIFIDSLLEDIGLWLVGLFLPSTVQVGPRRDIYLLVLAGTLLTYSRNVIRSLRLLPCCCSCCVSCLHVFWMLALYLALRAMSLPALDGCV
ncbi:hypothetical protein N657DRAFT_52123 [Parathielavia appendiculata]|uniref:Uncharacterized protein n=1 Tax=Parathielavia appendiculata TaxID=2587402 RepID=A0AAN6UAK1_9PEZI|nr:hypothetical protein N657DRAFT_52123 [Parathielavia appendiculata]